MKNENGTIAHAELTLGGGMIMLGSQKDDEYSRSFKTPEELGGIETHSVYLVVADADAAYARAVAAGAVVIRSADRPVPGFQHALELAHELAGVGAVDEAVVEAQAEVLHRANRDGVVALGVGQHHRLLAQAADGQNRRLRLVDDGRAELAAEDAGVGQREGDRRTSSGSSFLARARSARSAMARASSRKLRSSACLTTGTISPHSRATAMPRLMLGW
jgi:hypothetical protein